MTPSQFQNRRLAVYLSGLRLETPRSLPAPAASPSAVETPDQNTIVCGASETAGHIFRRYADRYRRTELRGVLYKNYIREAQELFRSVDPAAVFAVYPGDSRSRFKYPTIVKSRLTADRDSPCVLLPLGRKRHWKDLAEVNSNDRPYRTKDNRVVWRGATTGSFTTWNGAVPYSARFHVASLGRKPDFDIGYSKIVQITPETSDLPASALHERLLPPLTMADQLQSKFLLSLEGNDVATGLKWMLLSNSVVLMPHPTCETWACEGELVPFEHYVPVRDDLSDLDRVHDWCLAHEAQCEDIAQNATTFMSRFLDPDTEKALCRAVIAEYLSQTQLELRFGLGERILQPLTRFRWRRAG